MQITAATATAADIDELVRLYRTQGIAAADDQARVLIITRNMDAAETAALFSEFVRKAYVQ